MLFLKAFSVGLGATLGITAALLGTIVVLVTISVIADSISKR